MTKIKKRVTNKKRGGCAIGVLFKCGAPHKNGAKCNKVLNHAGRHSSTDGHKW